MGLQWKLYNGIESDIIDIMGMWGFMIHKYYINNKQQYDIWMCHDVSEHGAIVVGNMVTKQWTWG